MSQFRNSKQYLFGPCIYLAWEILDICGRHHGMIAIDKANRMYRAKRNTSTVKALCRRVLNIIEKTLQGQDVVFFSLYTGFDPPGHKFQ